MSIDNRWGRTLERGSSCTLRDGGCRGLALRAQHCRSVLIIGQGVIRTAGRPGPNRKGPACHGSSSHSPDCWRRAAAAFDHAALPVPVSVLRTCMQSMDVGVGGAVPRAPDRDATCCLTASRRGGRHWQLLSYACTYVVRSRARGKTGRSAGGETRPAGTAGA